MKLLLWLLGNKRSSVRSMRSRSQPTGIHSTSFFKKKLVCLIVLVKDIFDIYLNNIYHIVFSLHLLC